MIAAGGDGVAVRSVRRSNRSVTGGDRSDLPIMRSLDDQFRADAARVLSRFRRAIEQVVYSVTKTVSNSRSLQAALGIDLHTSWQLYKLLGPSDVLCAVTCVPPAVSIRKLCSAAKKQGVAQAALDEVADSHAEYEALIAKSTGDREQFESMVMSFTDSPEAAQVGVQLRKSAFKVDVHYFGTSAETLAVGMLFHPGSVPGKVDVVSVRTMLGLRRLRASTDVIIERAKVGTDQTGRPNTYLLPTALDQDAAREYSAAIVPEFCSEPILPLTTTVDELGNVRTVLEHRDLGVGEEVDLTTARIYRDSTFSPTPDGRDQLEGLVEIARPTKLQIIDTIVHRPTWPRMIPTTGVYAHLPSRDPAHLGSAVKLPFHERIACLGSGADVLRVNEVPRYRDLVAYACRKVGWNIDDMDVYRLRIEYPLMDTNVLFRLEVPPTPGQLTENR